MIAIIDYDSYHEFRTSVNTPSVALYFTEYKHFTNYLRIKMPRMCHPKKDN